MDDFKIVVFWRSGGERVRELVQKLPRVEFAFVGSEEELAEEIGDSQALILSGLEYSSSVLQVLRERGGHLQWMQATSAGVDKFFDCGLPEGIVFTRGGGLWDKPVAEHAMAMILAFARKILYIDRLQRHREWAKWPVDAAINSLEGKILGILGYGGVGRELARKGKSFDMELWGLCRKQEGLDTLLDRMLGPEDLATLLQTYHLIGADELRLMNKDAILVNVARGGIVDEQALVKTLEDGHLAGAGLDVYEEEPLPADHPFWEMENVIVSPHVAGATELRVDKALRLIEDNIRRFLEGRPLLHPVDLQAGY
jgi:D-2-hydroxyacid dehydrogenase (NADP+)